MKLGIVIYSNDPETVWNAFRFGTFALKEGDQVKVFLTGKGVEAESLDTDTFAVTGQMKGFVEVGGKIYTCGTCLNLRNAKPTDLCPLAGMKDLRAIIAESDRIITF
ncbi:MAG TPA: DsrE family protein [Dissulfurispiraceae bacterium]